MALNAALLFAELVFSGGLAFPAHTDAFMPWKADLTPERLAEVNQRMNRSVTDKNFGFHPDNMGSSEAFREGRLPLWNRFQMGGFPPLGQSLYGIFYPLNLPLFLFGPDRLYTPLTLVHFVLAGFFTYLLLRRFGLSYPAALMGGMVFICSANMTARFHFYMTVYPMTWAPLMLYFVDRYHRNGSVLSLSGLAFTGAMVILAGFQQIAVYLFYLCLIFSLFCSAPGRFAFRPGRGIAVVAGLVIVSLLLILAGLDPPTVYSFGILLAGLGFLAAGKGFWGWIRTSLPVALALLLGVGLSAVQMVPVLALMPHSMRALVGPGGMVAQGTPLGPGLLGFFLPQLLCDPMWAYSSSPLNLAGMVLTKRPEIINYVENSLYLGILPLAFIGCLGTLSISMKRRGVKFIGALSLLFLVIGFGPGAIIYPLWLIPGFQFGAPQRALLVFSFLGSLLAAYGFERLLAGATGKGRVLVLVVVLLTLAAASGAAGILSSRSIARSLFHRAESDPAFSQIPLDQERSEEIIEDNALQIKDALLHLALAAALGGIALVRLASRPGRLALLFVCLAVLADLLPLSWHVNRPQNPEGFLDLHESIALMQPKEENDHFRIFRYMEEGTFGGSTVPFPCNMNTHFRIEDGEGYIVQPLKRYFKLVDAVQPGIAPPGIAIYPITRPEALRSVILDLVGVRFIIATKAIPEEAGFEELYNKNGIFVYRNDRAFPRAFLVSKAKFFDTGEPDIQDRVLQSILSPGVDLRSEVMLEAAFKEIQAEKGPLPAAKVKYPCPEEVEITFEGHNPGGFLVLTDAYHPGWRAEVDGNPTPIMPADIAFRAVAVPEGSQRVSFRYDPVEVKIGAAITLFSGLVLLAGCLVGILRGKRKQFRDR